jgi:uncharacterized membrane protein YkoI
LTLTTDNVFLRKTLILSTVAACTALAAGTAKAQRAKAVSGEQVTRDAKLRSKTRVGEAAARATALKEVPNGRIEAGELEREKGKSIYSFDIKVPGRSGIEEVHVDAMSGAVVAHEHESPAAEKKEAALEAKEKKGSSRP